MHKQTKTLNFENSSECWGVTDKKPLLVCKLGKVPAWVSLFLTETVYEMRVIVGVRWTHGKKITERDPVSHIIALLPAHLLRPYYINRLSICINALVESTVRTKTQSKM